jgi:membrane protein insertase Oxa1/YidC/SpoIIIJ
MNCPVCSADLAPGATNCPACHAFQSVERTPLGVFSGWVGVVSAALTAMMLALVPFILIAGASLHGFPWILPIIGIVLTVGALWYSRSTRHTIWLARKIIQ